MVELVPVIELNHSNTDIAPPNNGPFWEHGAEWDQYYAACYSKLGYPDPFPVYLSGAAFCRIEDISDKNLQKLVITHTKEMREGKYSRDEASALFGGYVLRINGNDMYFPQCCGDLSDIQYWQKLAFERNLSFYSGHPEPMISIKDKQIIFDFTVEEFEENFKPPVKEKTIEVDTAELANAVEEVRKQLEIFAGKLITINNSDHLNIPSIDKLLIWGDDT